MKTVKGIREHEAERHALYSSFDEEDEEEILPLKRESVLDYLDEEEE